MRAVSSVPLRCFIPRRASWGLCGRGAYLVPRFALAALTALLVGGCASPPPAAFPWTDAHGVRIVYRETPRPREGEGGTLSLSRPTASFVASRALVAGATESFELELSRSGSGGEAPRVFLRLFSSPKEGKPLFEGSLALRDQTTRWAIPLPPGAVLARAELAFERGDETVRIAAMRQIPRFCGFARAEGAVRLSPGFSLARRGGSLVAALETPFEGYAPPASGAPRAPALVLEYGARREAAPASGVVRIAAPSGEPLVVRLKQKGARLVLPARLFGDSPSRLAIEAPADLDLLALYVSELSVRDFETVDLGLVLLLPPRAEGGDYDLYRWDILPSVLVFDFRDYATQDRYLKRLAFFVEKKGFKGRLAPDEEIAPLHGWNAHDYRPEDLCAFFSAAAEQSFPLNAQELSLEALLVDRGLLRREDGRLKAGKGAIISITRESAPYLRRMFLTHESTHALFFADEEWRRFVEAEWEAMPSEEKWFWKLYFGWMNYDTSNAYLMANEYQAYLLQQPVARAEEYFTKVLPARLLENHPELKSPLSSYFEKFGGQFALRASRLEAQLAARYGILAGRAHFIQ